MNKINYSNTQANLYQHQSTVKKPIKNYSYFSKQNSNYRISQPGIQTLSRQSKNFSLTQSHISLYSQTQKKPPKGTPSNSKKIYS
jgi:hypothetical protein